MTTEGAFIPSRWGATVLVLIALIASLDVCQSSSEIQILSAERRIDLTSSIVREYLTLKVENTGNSEASNILLAFPPTQAKHIALVKAQVAEGKRKKRTHTEAAVNPANLPEAPNNATLYSISLLKPLKSLETVTLEVLLVSTHSLEAFPAEISQSDSQLVYYHDSAVLLSPYHVKEQITYVKTPSSKVESFTRVDPTNRVGSEIKYGRYSDIQPYSYLPILVHFENNNPFAAVEELVRQIEISHWGSIQVTESYKLVHAGARLKGIFSRLDYQSRASMSGVSSFRHLLAKLPPRVHSAYYRDSIGNISSSHLRTNFEKSELELEPRYPLFGGWKTTFVIGYSLPLEDFLFESADGRRYLNFSFGTPIVETVVDKLTVKVLLPEGSKNPSAVVPFHVQQLFENSFSYLDVVGRPTVVLKKENVVPEHNVFFQVYYDFSQVFMLVEPLILAVAFFMFFVACISYLHIDLSIRKF